MYDCRFSDNKNEQHLHVLIIGPHHLHAVHRCGQLLQMLYTAWSVMDTRVSLIFEWQSRVGPKNVVLAWGPYFIGNGTFERVCTSLT